MRKKRVYRRFQESKIKHNQYGEKIYLTYYNMLSRCYNPKANNYRYWGGSGIEVCDRWKKNFLNFYEDMGPPPSNDHSIDRIDPNGNYTPKNCRWATAKIQRHNRRKSCENVAAA